MSSKSLKISLVVGLVALVLVVALVWLNVSRLTRKVAEARVPGLSIGEVSVAWNSVRLTDFRYVSGNSLITSIEARSVDAHPTFLSFLHDEIEVRSLVIQSPRFRLINQTEDKNQPPGPVTAGQTAEPVRAGFKQIRLEGGHGEIEDRTVTGPPARLILDQIEVLLENFRYPAAAGSTGVDASCVIKGQPDGKARIVGWLDSVNQSAELRVETESLDLKDLRPYLRDKVHAIDSADGTVDLRLDLVMSNGAYTAMGELGLYNLQLPRNQEHPSLPTRLLTQYLKLHGNRVAIPFKITGDARKKEHRLDLSALLSAVINQEIGNEALEKKIGLPKSLDRLDQDLRRLKERAKELKKRF